MVKHPCCRGRTNIKGKGSWASCIAYLAVGQCHGGLVATRNVHVRPREPRPAPGCTAVQPEDARLLCVVATCHHNVAVAERGDARAEHVMVCFDNDSY
jgi:hypothetical protein